MLSFVGKFFAFLSLSQQTGTRIEQGAAAGVLAHLCEVIDERLAIASSKVVQPCMEILQGGTPTGQLAASRVLKNLALTVESRLKCMKEVEYVYDVLIKVVANEKVEGAIRENCATALQAFCATTSGEEGLEARLSLGKGGAIEACVKLLLDGPDAARVPAAGVLQYLAQVEELKPRFVTAGAIVPLIAVAGRETVDMWGRAYAAGALRWLSMTHDNMRPIPTDDVASSKGKGDGEDADAGEDDDDSEPTSTMAGMSLAELAPKARFRVLQGAPMDAAQSSALDELKTRIDALVTGDCAKVMCKLLMPPKDEDGVPIAKPAGKKKKAAPREPDVETAHTHATGVLRHLMLDPNGMQHVLDMNGVTHITPLLESPNTQLRANAHAILSLTTLEVPFVNAMKRAGAPEFYTNLLEVPMPKPATPAADPLAFTRRPASSSGRADIK